MLLSSRSRLGFLLGILLVGSLLFFIGYKTGASKEQGITGKAVALGVRSPTGSTSSTSSTSSPSDSSENGYPADTSALPTVQAAVATQQSGSVQNSTQQTTQNTTQNTTRRPVPLTRLASSLTDIFKLVLELRDNYKQNKTVNVAETVTLLNVAVRGLGISSVEEAWETLALCLASHCADEQFLEFIRVIAIEGEKQSMPDALLIENLLTANKYWNTDNTVRFSEAVTNVNKEVTALGKASLTATWTAIVQCGGTCDRRISLLFDFLKQV